jgi:hypothetical protein
MMACVRAVSGPEGLQAPAHPRQLVIGEQDWDLLGWAHIEVGQHRLCRCGVGCGDVETDVDALLVFDLTSSAHGEVLLYALSLYFRTS